MIKSANLKLLKVEVMGMVTAGEEGGGDDIAVEEGYEATKTSSVREKGEMAGLVREKEKEGKKWQHSQLTRHLRVA
ncbi:hypothetical protein D5086_030906 [Populus alba]|uniref:Uncharacterized protein n=1 Tax=Populus alba TaxID=43335 RepID=A0ACC4APT8_POPAL